MKRLRTRHDDITENVPVTTRPLDGGENSTTVIRVESEKSNAIMPEMESTDRGEEKEDRLEMSDILVGSSGKSSLRYSFLSHLTYDTTVIDSPQSGFCLI